jgi:hypothetical protein
MLRIHFIFGVSEEVGGGVGWHRCAYLPFSRLLVVPSRNDLTTCLAGDIPSFEEAIFVAWYGVGSRDGLASQGLLQTLNSS